MKLTERLNQVISNSVALCFTSYLDVRLRQRSQVFTRRTDYFVREGIVDRSVMDGYQETVPVLRDAHRALWSRRIDVMDSALTGLLSEGRKKTTNLNLNFAISNTNYEILMEQNRLKRSLAWSALKQALRFRKPGS